MKVVELNKLNNFYFENFSSHYAKSNVILEFPFWPNSNWIFPQFWIWISYRFTQIHTLPLKIGSGSLNKFCRVSNFEQTLFWPKFDFYSKLWSNWKKQKGGIKSATVLTEGDALRQCRRWTCSVPRRHAPGHAAAWQLARHPLYLLVALIRTTEPP